MDDKSINKHYGISGIMDSIMSGLESSGKDFHALNLDDLAPIDEFHTRGKESTIEIADLAQIQQHHQILDVGLLPRLRMKIDRNQIKYVGKEVSNLDAVNVLGVSEDSESCTVYDNFKEKILEIRPRDSHRFGISRSNLIAIQKKIRNNDSQVKLQKGTIKKLQKAFSDIVSGNFRNDNRNDSDSMTEQEVIMK